MERLYDIFKYIFLNSNTKDIQCKMVINIYLGFERKSLIMEWGSSNKTVSLFDYLTSFKKKMLLHKKKKKKLTNIFCKRCSF